MNKKGKYYFDYICNVHLNSSVSTICIKRFNVIFVHTLSYRDVCFVSNINNKPFNSNSHIKFNALIIFNLSYNMIPIFN